MGDLSQRHVDAFFANTPVKEWKLGRYTRLLLEYQNAISSGSANQPPSQNQCPDSRSMIRQHDADRKKRSTTRL